MGGGPVPHFLSGGSQLLNGPTQYLTLNSVIMSLEYDLYHSSCYSAYAVVIIVVVIYTHIAISSELFRNISVCYRAIKDRQAIVAIFTVFWSLRFVKVLKYPLPPPKKKVATGLTPLGKLKFSSLHLNLGLLQKKQETSRIAEFRC